jgi:hypothetical protein
MQDTNEFDSIVDALLEALVDNITQQIELIKQRSK